MGPLGLLIINCGSTGPILECFPMTILAPEHAIIVAADIAIWGIITLTSGN